jgi:lysyl-tRNA synthetase, class II
MNLIAIDAIRFHRFGLGGREPLLLMLAASLLTFAGTRLYTRLARVRSWRSGRVGGVHLHHLVVGNVLVLLCGMLQLAFQPGDIGVDILSVGFGVGAAFVLDEFALSVHLRDVYWTSAGRHSIEVSLMWVLLGALLLVGISPFGIHDSSEGPRIVGFIVVAVSIVLSVVTCLKGKLTLGLLSIFLPPVGLVAAVRLARPGSVWASVFYRDKPEKRRRAGRRFDPEHSGAERLRLRLHDLIGGAHDLPFIHGPRERTRG